MTLPKPFLRTVLRALPALAALSALISCSVHRPDPWPASARDPLPDRWRKEPILILADSTSLTVGVEGDSNVLAMKSVTWYRVNRRNPPVLETLVFRDDETTERPLRFRVDAYYPGGKRVTRTDADCKRVRMDESGLLASNGFQSSVLLEGYREGLIIRRETEEIVTRPQFRGYETLRSDYPCLSRAVSFRAPQDYDLKAALRNGERLRVRADTVAAEGFRELRFQADSLEKLPPDLDYKYPEERLAAFWFSVPPRGKRSWTWRELGDHYLALIRPSLEARPGLPADPGLKPGADPEAAVRSAFALVQNHIRYLADEEKMNAYVPRPPDRIWSNGYGDCKEMANLLRAMSAQAKVDVGLALIQAGGGFQLREEFPSLGNFNHMIAWRRVGDGGLRFYDPTVNFGSAPGSALHLMYQKALLLAPGKSAPDTVAPSEGCPNRIVTKSRLVRAAQGGPLSLEGEIDLKGAVAFSLILRLRYRDVHPEDARAAVRAFLRNGFGIEANTLAWKESGSDSIAITYAHGKEMAADAEGLALELPTLFSEWDGTKTGFLPPFTQQDDWRLPAGYGVLSAKDYRNSLGDLAWTSGNGSARRSFTGRLARYRPGEEEAGRAVKDSLIFRSVGWVGK